MACKLDHNHDQVQSCHSALQMLYPELFEIFGVHPCPFTPIGADSLLIIQFAWHVKVAGSVPCSSGMFFGYPSLRYHFLLKSDAKHKQLNTTLNTNNFFFFPSRLLCSNIFYKFTCQTICNQLLSSRTFCHSVELLAVCRSNSHSHIKREIFHVFRSIRYSKLNWLHPPSTQCIDQDQHIELLCLNCARICIFN